MAHRLKFGKHKGKTLEWLFFNDPGYVEYITKKGINNDPRKFPPYARDRFQDLVRRASHLKIPGLCPWCKKRPITRMFFTQHISGGLAGVDFDCDVCEPKGSSPSTSLKPAFFTPDIYRNYDKTGARFLIRAIKHAYFKNPSFKMTQKRLEEFFNYLENFVNF